MTRAPSTRRLRRRRGRRSVSPRDRARVIEIIRDMLGRAPQPPYSKIAAEIRRRCPWSSFGYDIFKKTYLPRWKRGVL